MTLTSYQAPIGSSETELATKDNGGFSYEIAADTGEILADLSPAQRNAFYKQMEANANQEIERRKDAEIDRRIGESLKIAWDRIDREGSKGSYRMADGRVEKLNQQGVDYNPVMGGYVATDINTIDLDFGGMVLSQDNARDMLDQGVISEAQFVAAVERSMHKVQPSFVLTQRAFERLAYRK